MNNFNNPYIERLMSTRRRMSDDLLVNTSNHEDSGIYCSDNEIKPEKENEFICARKPLTEKCFIYPNGFDIFSQGIFNNNFDDEPIFG